MAPRTLDHFARQDQARRNTAYLLWLYLLAIAGIIATVYFIWQILSGGVLWDPQVFLFISAGVIVVVGGGSLIKISQLASGGARVAEMLGGRLVDITTQDPQLRQLLNVVEEMALASGLPVPAVYLLNEDHTINAFAAGFTADDAAIGVTRGTLERLTRDELQGVIAHEFSHILNGDMRLNIRLMGLLFGVLCLAILGRVLLHAGISSRSSRSSDGKNSGGVAVVALLGVGMFVAGMIGVFFARLIQAAVSRQREFLADAAAVQFTRNPQGIASALYKIGRYSGRISSPDAAEAAHLFFGNGLSEPWFGWFSTHPPLEKRIAAIDPHFDPDAVRHRPPPLPAENLSGASAPVPWDWMGHRREAPSPPVGPIISLAGAQQMLANLPSDLQVQVRELGGAVAMVYALLLHEEESLRARQFETLRQGGVGEAMLNQVQACFEQLLSTSNAQKINLLDLAVPTLRQLSSTQYQAFRKNTRNLIGTDGQVNLFEYLLQTAMARHLERFFQPVRKTEPEIRHLLAVLPDVAVVLSAVAYLGDFSEEVREQAYAAGIRELMVRSDDPVLQRVVAPGIEALDQALQRLARSALSIRRQVLLASAQVAMFDGGSNANEGQLLRILADALDCPVPPFVQPLPE